VDEAVEGSHLESIAVAETEDDGQEPAMTTVKPVEKLRQGRRIGPSCLRLEGDS